jgi:hypothetical protein
MSQLQPARPASIQRTSEPGFDQRARVASEIGRLMGPLQRIRTEIAVSAHAGRTLREVRNDDTDAKARIAKTATAIAEVQMTTAMVARAVPVIAGTLAQLNAQANAADQNYTTQEAAAVESHFHARKANRTAIEQDARDFGLSQQEVDVALSFAEANMADDIARTRRRTARCKEAADALNDRALMGILNMRLPSVPGN